MTDYQATRTGDEVQVRLSNGWTITHTDGRRLADISSTPWPVGDSEGRLIDAIQVVEWEWVPPEGGAAHATTTATVESLAAALDEYVRDHAGADDRTMESTT
jgi:hypothetical protein